MVGLASLRYAAVVLILGLWVAVAWLGISQLGKHTDGLLWGDHHIGPLRSGDFVTQTFETRYPVLKSARIHFIRMTDDAGGSVELSLRRVAAGEVIARRTVPVDRIAKDGTFLEVLTVPVEVSPRELLEITAVIPNGQPGGIGATAQSGNRFLFGQATRNGAAVESDILFIADSETNLAGIVDWLQRRACEFAVLGCDTMRYAALAIFGFVTAAIVLLLGLLPAVQRVPPAESQTQKSRRD